MSDENETDRVIREEDTFNFWVTILCIAASLVILGAYICTNL